MPVDKKKVAKLAKKPIYNLTEAEWDARGDAWALMSAQQVRNDPKRLAAAQEWAAVLAQQGEDEAETFQNIADA